MMIPKTVQPLIPVDSLPDVESVLIEVELKFVTVLFGNGQFANCDEFCVVVVEFTFVDGAWAPEMLVALAGWLFLLTSPPDDGCDELVYGIFSLLGWFFAPSDSTGTAAVKAQPTSNSTKILEKLYSFILARRL